MNSLATMNYNQYSEEHSIVLGERYFLSKSQLVAWIKTILNPIITPYKLSDEIKSIIEALLNYHPKAIEKIGSGIKEIWVESNGSLRSGNRFVVVRNDDTRCDFSYKYCLGKSLPSHPLRVREAMRNAVRPYVTEYKSKYFTNNQDQEGYALCELTKKKIHYNSVDVDHMPPYSFENLVVNFLLENDLKFKKIKLEKKDEVSLLMISDPYIKNKWIDFHNQKCHLRIIDKNTHRIISSV